MALFLIFKNDKNILKNVKRKKSDENRRNVVTCFITWTRQCQNLVDFDHHTTGLDVIVDFLSCPVAVAVLVDEADRALAEPPAAVVVVCTRASTGVVVVVQRAERFPVGVPPRPSRSCHGVARVSAVAGHRQLVLTDLVTDGKRRVFGPVPQTISTVDLPKPT